MEHALKHSGGKKTTAIIQLFQTYSGNSNGSGKGKEQSMSPIPPTSPGLLMLEETVVEEEIAVGEEAVAWYDLNGISNQRHLQMLRSNMEICHHFQFSILSYFLLNWRYVLKQLSKSILPASCINLFKKTLKN